tara:strand:+ start:1063 stop:1287 length:225 start_codon:yes stop_codon:yes gene_type:complete
MKIEKNIPIPSRRGRKGRYAFVYDMEYGDSIVTTEEKEKQKISAHIRYSDKNCRVVVRTLEDGSIRVWKVKKDD